MKVQLVVRYVTGLRDTVIDTDSDSDIVKNLPTSYIRQQIRAMHPELSKRRLKLLHNGRVLTSHTDFRKEISYLKKSLEEGEQEEEGETGETVNGHSNIEPVRIYFHCIVGDELTSKELADEEKMDQQPTKSTTEAPKGFDRLLSQGFSNDDIEDLRRQFFRLHGSQLPSNANPSQIRELEDRWIDSSVNHEIDEFPSNMRLNLGSSGNNSTSGGINNENDDDDDESTTPLISGSNGFNPANNVTTTNSSNDGGMNVRQQMIQRDRQVHKEMLLGVCVGFALGGLALLLLFLDVGGVFSKKTRFAVISGVIVNLCFGVLKLWGQ